MVKQTLQVFKVLNTPQNESLISEISDSYFSQEPISKAIQTKLGVATIGASNENLEKIAVDTDDYHIMYVGVADGRIVSTFTHIYDAVSHEMYLYESFTHESQQKRGYATAFYKQIIKDIFSNPEVYDICASAMSDGGRRLLANLGFQPNTLAYSYGGNSILFSPHYKLKPSYVRLEAISHLVPDRDFTNAPNVDAYNDALTELILSGGYDEVKEVKAFKRGHNDYLKHSAKKSLKLKSKENVQVAEPATVGVVPNLVFTFSPMEHIDTASVATQNEIEYNLKRLQEAQKIGSHTPKK